MILGRVPAAAVRAETVDVFAERFASMWDSFIRALPGIAVAIVTVALTLLLARVVKRAVRSSTRSAGVRPGLSLLISRVWSGSIITLGLLLALAIAIPSLDFAAALGALGIGGIVIGFALKDIVQNFLAGILILYNRPFRLGDQIRSGDHEGTVEDIQVRATLLRTYDNRRVVIPNSELFTNRVVVNTAYDKVRLAVTFTVPSTESLSQIRQLILDTVGAVSEVLEDPAPEVLVRELQDYSTQLEVRFWVDPPIRREMILAEDAVLTALSWAFVTAGMKDIMPVQRVVIDQEVA
ncbi:MAG: mechanosensitive ion channel [Intrasporangiaceae bacterium]|nr:mechanosensitive ion channel [Intrasporangiaceae bacterium]